MNPASARRTRTFALVAAVLSFASCAQSAHVTHRVRHRPPVSVAVAPSATVPATETTPGPRLAIIIDDCGQWLQTERAFIALSIPLTLSVLPDVRYTHLISQEAVDAGKGVMLHLPMQPISHLDPGPGKIMTSMSDAQIVAQVDTDLADVPLAEGVNNHEGSAATADARVMRDVAQALATHGHLFFVDSLTIGDSVAAAETRAHGVPTGERDVFLDDVNTVQYVEEQLLRAAEVARRNGHAIAIGHPRPATLAALQALVPSMQASGIQFVLVSQLLEPAAQPAPASPGHMQ